MIFKLPKLPYEKNALEPFISEETLNYHYDKHHTNYLVNLNAMIKGTKFTNKSLEDIIKTATGDIFNNAAQVWNHNFYWNSLSPQSNQIPTGIVAEEINKSFGSLEILKEKLTEAAINNFGSGWTWLVKKVDNSLAIVNTSNAVTIITEVEKPLLTIDVWEHAYYVDYRNERSTYLKNLWSLINWKFVTENYL